MSSSGVVDISKAMETKTDQLNNVDLIPGPITVKILDVQSFQRAEQPVVITISEPWKPWKPCKGMMRLLTEAWPDSKLPMDPETKKRPVDASRWVGRWVTLVRDPTVKYGADIHGGIRVSAVSNITKPMEISVPTSRGKSKTFAVSVLSPSASSGTPSEPPKQEPKPAVEQHPLTAPFNAMKARWKSRREDRGMPVTADEFRAFIGNATEGLIANVMNPAAYTVEVIQKCVETIDFEMPEQG